MLEAALPLLAPFLDPDRLAGGAPLVHSAYRTLRETHPEWDGAQTSVLIAAAERYYALRNRE